MLIKVNAIQKMFVARQESINQFVSSDAVLDLLISKISIPWNLVAQLAFLCPLNLFKQCKFIYSNYIYRDHNKHWKRMENVVVFLSLKSYHQLLK